jgi:EPS-associated MarR family transcriptional regulator
LSALIDDGLRYRILKQLQQDPAISQRDLAQVLGLSLGKTNYCLRALIQKGLVKANNFRNSHNKLAYAYLLTPKGLEEKARVTLRFLKARMAEYDALEREIAELRREVQVPPIHSAANESGHS